MLRQAQHKRFDRLSTSASTGSIQEIEKFSPQFDFVELTFPRLRQYPKRYLICFLNRVHEMKLSEKTNQEIIDQLTKIADNFDSTKENYLLAYPHFLNYFQNLETIILKNLIIGISFTYSWMPTTLKSIKLENPKKFFQF